MYLDYNISYHVKYYKKHLIFFKIGIPMIQSLIKYNVYSVSCLDCSSIIIEDRIFYTCM